MKKLKILSSIVTAILLMGISNCNPVAPIPKTELEKLPPATQQGKYTFGCLVNGKAWVPSNSIAVTAVYQFGRLTIGGKFETKEFTQRIVMSIFESDIAQIEYELNDSVNRYAEFSDADTFTNCNYLTDGSNENKGALTITNFDKINLIVSGNFQFIVSAKNCTQYKVSDGRFDLKFIP